MKLYLTNNKTFTKINLLVLFVILVIISITMSNIINKSKKNSQVQKCKHNLKMLNQAMIQYVEFYGNNLLHPDTNGGGFLARLYQKKFTQNKSLYLCPATEDKTSDSILNNMFAEDKDTINGTSYAGRKNKDPVNYPGIMKTWSKKTSGAMYDMAVISDDWQGTPNHNNGKMINVIYVEGVVQTFKNPEAAGNDYITYSKGNSKIFLQVNNLEIYTEYPIADPLTN